METLEAEVSAVHSEFNERKREWRRVHNFLLCHTSKDTYPYHNIFAGGNRQSLMGENIDCHDLRKEVLKFYRKRYTAKKMKLVVVGGESLDKLQGWIEKLFNSIKKCPVKKVKSKKRKRKLPKRPIWRSGEKYHLVLKNTDILVVSWTLMSLRKVYEHKPEEYISYFLNQKGEGSLISLLKDLGLATSLIAEISGGIARTANMYSITIGLTNSGILEINKIIGLIYEYLSLLRDSPPEWMFEEIQSIGELKFNFGEESNQREYVVKLSENLLLYPPKHVLYADHLYKKWNEPLIKEVLDYFVPENMRVDVISDQFKMEAYKLVPWYGIPYSVQDIEERFIKLWKETQEANEPLKLPCKNEFIPNNTSILVDVGDMVDKDFSNMIHPECIFVDDSMKLWYKRDCTFKVPFTCICIQIMYSKALWDNVKTCALSELFLTILCDKLSEVTDKARDVMLKTELRSIDGMLEVKVFGLNEMLPSFLNKVLSEVKSFVPTDVSHYELMKEKLKGILIEGDDVILETCLSENTYASHEKVKYVDDLSLDDVKKYIEEIRSQTSIEGLVYGNLSMDDANGICKIIKDIFPEKSGPLIRHVERVICLTPKTNYVLTYDGTSDIISTAQLYIQIGHNLFNSIDGLALLDLFDVIVEKPFFDQMRNEKNLGYTVESSIYELNNVWGFCFLIESSDYNPNYLHREMEEFIDDGLEKVFEDLDNKTFEKYRSSLVENLKSCSSLKDECCQAWTEITNYSGKFNIAQKKAEALKQITKKDCENFYREYFKKSSYNCSRLKVNVLSKRFADDSQEEEDEEVDPVENDSQDEEDEEVDLEENVDPEEDDEDEEVDPEVNPNYW